MIKKFFKWGFIGFIGLIVLIVVVVVTSSGGETDNTVEKASGEANDQTDDKEKPKEKVANIGDALTVGDVVFTINGRSTAKNVGGEYGEDAQGKYLILNVSVKNKGEESLMVDGSFFKLKADGKTYEADTMASTYANEAGKSFFLQQLNPGISQKGKVVFDVPAKMIDTKDLKVQVQTGLFGTETGMISLEK